MAPLYIGVSVEGLRLPSGPAVTKCPQAHEVRRLISIVGKKSKSDFMPRFFQHRMGGGPTTIDRFVAV